MSLAGVDLAGVSLAGVGLAGASLAELDIPPSLDGDWSCLDSLHSPSKPIRSASMLTTVSKDQSPKEGSWIRGRGWAVPNINACMQQITIY